jgi:hypothetical protein
MRIFRTINLCTQLAVTAISHKIINNCCHLGFLRPYFISKTYFLRFYYFCAKSSITMHRFMFFKESLLILFCFNSMKFVIKLRYLGPFWTSIIFFPQGCQSGTQHILIIYTLKNMKHQYNIVSTLLHGQGSILLD